MTALHCRDVESTNTWFYRDAELNGVTWPGQNTNQTGFVWKSLGSLNLSSLTVKAVLLILSWFDVIWWRAEKIPSEARAFLTRRASRDSPLRLFRIVCMSLRDQGSEVTGISLSFQRSSPITENAWTGYHAMQGKSFWIQVCTKCIYLIECCAKKLLYRVGCWIQINTVLRPRSRVWE